MYDEYLESQNMLRNAFISSPLKSIKKKILFTKNRYHNYLSQSPSQAYSPSANCCKVVGLATKHKKETQNHSSITKLLDIVSPQNKLKVTKTKPKELRGLSISDHMTREKQCFLPSINQRKQSLVDFNDDLEGYKLKSEEMSFEIDEYMRMKQQFILPSIY